MAIRVNADAEIVPTVARQMNHWPDYDKSQTNPDDMLKLINAIQSAIMFVSRNPEIALVVAIAVTVAATIIAFYTLDLPAK